MESGSQFDSSRAELFEALGHPTRVKILRTLEAKPMGFAELKREVGIESSGHLQFHLGKLNGLVSTNVEGSYTLTDDGREAIRVLKAIPTGSEQIPTISKVSHRPGDWLKPLLAVLLIAIVALAGVAIYQQEQITALNRNLSSATTTIGGTSYYYESVPDSFNGTDVSFHGVTFTFLHIPLSFDYSNPKNYTYAGSVRLTNGTLLNLNGKTVMFDMANDTLLPGFALTFPDGSVATHQQYTLTARYDYTIPGYLLTYAGIWPITNPWFTQHDNVRAGVFWNITNTTEFILSPTLTIYVRVQT
jgi:DNA-binding HxlR family transcriptional regulator